MSSSRVLVAGARAIAVVLVAGTAACMRTSPVRVATVVVDSASIAKLKTFALKAPQGEAVVRRGAIVGDTTHQAAGSVVMEMDPMLATSEVGQALRQDLSDAFTKRGYETASGSPDFYVAYYAGTGSVVSTHAAEQSYHTNGSKITRETYEYPAGTVVVDVVDAHSDSLVWRGTGLAPIPDNPKDYAKAIRHTVDEVVEEFPKATR
jgi:hypothetical protein